MPFLAVRRAVNSCHAKPTIHPAPVKSVQLSAPNHEESKEPDSWPTGFFLKYGKLVASSPTKKNMNGMQDSWGFYQHGVLPIGVWKFINKTGVQAPRKKHHWLESFCPFFQPPFFWGGSINLPNSWMVKKRKNMDNPSMDET